MTIRVRKPLDINDGGSYQPINRPPTSMLTDRFKELFAEEDALRSRLSAAITTRRDLTDNWFGREAEALKKDSRATGESARKGGAPVTTAIDELWDTRRGIDNEINSTTEALKLIASDLGDAREEARKLLDTKTEEQLRAKVAKSLDNARQDITELVRHISYREWVTDHLPHDESTRLSLASLWAGAESTRNEGVAIDLNSIIDSLKSL